MNSRVKRVVKRLVRYVSIPSVSGEEDEMSEVLARDLERVGMEVRVDDLGNVIARRGEEPVVCLTSHMDTVPAGDMEDAFKPRLEEGKLFGRGSCDAKANLAVYVEVAALTDEPLEVIGVVREETDSAGIRRVLEEGEMKADQVINGEPTSLRPVIGHKSRVEVEVRLEGEEAHASTVVDDVVRKFCRLLHRLEGLFEGREDDLGRPTFAPTRVVAEGPASNVTPGELEALLDMRLNTRVDPSEVERFLSRWCDSVEVRAGAPPFVLEGNEPVVKALREALERRGLSADPVTWPASTDAGYIRHLGGKDVVVFGPGSIDVAHTDEEFVPVDELAIAVDVLVDVVRILSNSQKLVRLGRDPDVWNSRLRGG